MRIPISSQYLLLHFLHFFFIKLQSHHVSNSIRLEIIFFCKHITYTSVYLSAESAICWIAKLVTSVNGWINFPSGALEINGFLFMAAHRPRFVLLRTYFTYIIFAQTLLLYRPCSFDRIKPFYPQKLKCLSKSNFGKKHETSRDPRSDTKHHFYSAPKHQKLVTNCDNIIKLGILMTFTRIRSV